MQATGSGALAKQPSVEPDPTKSALADRQMWAAALGDDYWAHELIKVTKLLGNAEDAASAIRGLRYRRW